METLFYYFVKNSMNDTVDRRNPICSSKFIGDIGDYCEIDGVGYYIEDYTVENHSWEEGIA